MVFKPLYLYEGERINARVKGESLSLLISKGGAVYKAEISAYKTNPFKSGAELFIYCDEAAELENGEIIERRGANLKINLY